jgi:GNAT superfamily N-acetyltransferase
MDSAREYAAEGSLIDGSRIHVRAIHTDDRERLLAHFKGLSDRSVVFRFHGAKRSLSESELTQLTQVDFETHVALVATFGTAPERPIIGVARYIVIENHPDRAEVGFAVLDQFQGRGIGSLLLRHLAIIARLKGIAEFQADVLAHNSQMIEVFEHSGLPVRHQTIIGATRLIIDLRQANHPGQGLP